MNNTINLVEFFYLADEFCKDFNKRMERDAELMKKVVKREEINAVG